VGDELLVRGKDGMVPTARAEELALPVRRVIEDIARTLAPPRPFDPATARTRVTIGTSDYAELVLLPKLVSRFARSAPGIDLRTLTADGELVAPLPSGQLDLVVAPMRPDVERPGVVARRLFDERFVCVMRKGHPLADKPLTLRRFAGARHALISPRGREGGFVDDALRRLGLERRVVVAVPHFLIAPHVVAATDLVLTLAERIARTLAEPLGLVIKPVPRELEPEVKGFTMCLLWHQRTHGDPAMKWVRDQIAEVARES